MLKIAYETFTLANGLKTIVHSDHNSPKLVMNILYHVGSKNEDESRTGFAHLFEHLMFEGSKNIPNYDTPLQQASGENNAFTSSDITNYYLSLPSNQAEVAFWLESDRMLELAFSDEGLAVQKSVVIEEFKQRYLNQPYGDAMLKIRELAYKTHPYKWSTIGKEISHIEGATMEMVKDFFYGYYAPNNATLVLAGDISLERAKELAEKWFGDIPRRELKTKPLPQEPKQTEARYAETEGDVPFTAVYQMFHIAPYKERDYHVASLICSLVGEGKSAKMYQEIVVEQELASQVDFFPWGMTDAGVLSINAQLTPETQPEQYLAACRNVLDKIEDSTEEELVRVKTRIQSAFMMEKTELLNRAIDLAFGDFVGDIDFVNQLPELYDSITLEEVKRVAKEVFAPENSNVLAYRPK